MRSRCWRAWRAPTLTARAALATCRTRMSRPLHHGGKSALALAACKQARADLEALATVPGASNVSRHDFADTLNELGIVLWQTGKPAEAEPEFRTALRSSRSWPTTTLATLTFACSWRTAEFTLATC